MSITVTEITSTTHKGLSRLVGGSGAPGGTTRDIVVGGTYAAESPTNIYCRLLNYSDDSEVLSYRILDSSPGGGVFSGTFLAVPWGGHYKFEVRVDEAGSTDKTVNKFCVSMNIVGFGQSKINGFGDGGEIVILNDLACQYFYADRIYRHLIDEWQSVSQGVGTSPTSTFANSLIAHLGKSVTFGLYGLGGTGLVDDTVKKYTDRNPSDPDDGTTLYGRVLKIAAEITPEFVYIDIGDADAVVNIPKSEIVTAVETIHNWLETDLGYRPKILLVPCGRNEQSSVYHEGYAGFQTACQELHNGTDVFHLTSRYHFPVGVDGLHDNTAGQRILGNNMASSFIRLLNGSESRPGLITGAEKIGHNKVLVSISLPENLTIDNENFSGFMFGDSFTPDYTTETNGDSITVLSKHNITANRNLTYAYGSMPDITNPITNSDGDAILQKHDGITLGGNYSMKINGINVSDVVFCNYYANWINGPSTKQTGNHPSYPNGAYQDCEYIDCSNPGDGYVKNTPGEGVLSLTEANSSYQKTGWKLGVGTSSKFTIVMWFTKIPREPNKGFLIGNYVNATEYWYIYLDHELGWRNIKFIIRVGGNNSYVYSTYSILENSNDPHLYLIMIEKTSDDYKIYLWNTLNSGEVPSYPTKVVNNPGSYIFGDTVIGTADLGSLFTDIKFHSIFATNNNFTSDEKAAIFNAGKDLGWHGVVDGDSMSLLDLKMLLGSKANQSLGLGLGV